MRGVRLLGLAIGTSEAIHSNASALPRGDCGGIRFVHKPAQAIGAG